jgi:hypothetical protein
MSLRNCTPAVAWTSRVQKPWPSGACSIKFSRKQASHKTPGRKLERKNNIATFIQHLLFALTPFTLVAEKTAGEVQRLAQDHTDTGQVGI